VERYFQPPSQTTNAMSARSPALTHFVAWAMAYCLLAPAEAARRRTVVATIGVAILSLWVVVVRDVWVTVFVFGAAFAAGAASRRQQPDSVATASRLPVTKLSYGMAAAAMLCFKCFWTFFRHVASLCFKCFSYFRCMFQMFSTNVAKVDRDVVYVAMVVYVCCKRLSPMFHLFFVHVCCKCFRRMSQVFHLSSFVCASVCIWIF